MSEQQLEHVILRTMAESEWPPEPPSRRFAFLRYFQVEHPDGVYLRRWRWLETPLGGVMLHHVARPDGDRHLHDHPWPFVALVLRGWYIEEVPLRYLHGESTFLTRLRRVRWFNFKRARDAHRITEVSPGGAWTLVFRGPRSRCWGFRSEYGWIPWHVYLGAKEAQ